MEAQRAKNSQDGIKSSGYQDGVDQVRVHREWNKKETQNHTHACRKPDTWLRWHCTSENKVWTGKFIMWG